MNNESKKDDSQNIIKYLHSAIIEQNMVVLNYLIKSRNLSFLIKNDVLLNL